MSVCLSSEKYAKMVFLGLKTKLKFFSKVIFVPKSKLCEKFGRKWPLNWFLKGRSECAPPAIWDAFQMLLHVGLRKISGGPASETTSVYTDIFFMFDTKTIKISRN